MSRIGQGSKARWIFANSLVPVTYQESFLARGQQYSPESVPLGFTTEIELWLWELYLDSMDSDEPLQRNVMILPGSPRAPTLIDKSQDAPPTVSRGCPANRAHSSRQTSAKENRTSRIIVLHSIDSEITIGIEIGGRRMDFEKKRCRATSATGYLPQNYQRRGCGDFALRGTAREYDKPVQLRSRYRVRKSNRRSRRNRSHQEELSNHACSSKREKARASPFLEQGRPVPPPRTQRHSPNVELFLANQFSLAIHRSAIPSDIYFSFLMRH